MNKYVHYLIFLIMFILMLYTGTNSIGDFDSGLFYYIAVNGGIAHPPGYPIYSMINRGIYLLTHSKETISYWGINVLFTVMSFMVIYQFILKKKMGINSIYGILIVMLAPTIYRSATNIEPFSLHYLFVAFAMVAASSINENSTKNSYWFIWGALFGLSVCNHHIFAMLLPGTIWCLMRKISIKRILSFSLGLIICLIPIYYLIWQRNLEFDQLISYILRKGYGTFNLNQSETSIASLNPIASLNYYCISLYQQLDVFAFLMAIYGVYKKFSTRLISFYDEWLLISFMFSGPVFYIICRVDDNQFREFMINCFLGTSFIILIPFICHAISSIPSRYSYFAMLGLLSQFVHQLPWNYRKNERFLEQHIQNIITSVKHDDTGDAIVLISSNDQETFASLYYETKYELPSNIKFVHKVTWDPAIKRNEITTRTSKINQNMKDFVFKKYTSGVRIYETTKSNYFHKNFVTPHTLVRNVSLQS